MRCTQIQRSAHFLARRVGLGNQPLVRINQALQVLHGLRVPVCTLQLAAFRATHHIARDPANAGGAQQEDTKDHPRQEFSLRGHGADPVQVLYSPWRRVVSPRSGSSWPVLGLRYLSNCKMRWHASA